MSASNFLEESDSVSTDSFRDDTGIDLLEDAPFIEKKSFQKPRSNLLLPALFIWTWILTTLCLTVISGYLLFERLRLIKQCSIPKAAPFATDIQDSHTHISYEERVYTGKLGFDKKKGTVHREITGTQYFGLPSKEIDDAWDDLLRGEFVRLTATEAEPFTPALQRSPGSGYYYFEPDMFHSLHCLNAIRKALDPEYYDIRASHMDMVLKNSTAFPEDWPRIHRDHCLDQLRQSIQCHGDLSPSPLFSWEGVPIALGVSQTHTCRKWEPIRDWMDMRKKLHNQNLDW